MKWFSFSLKVVALAVAVLVIGSLSVKESAAQYPPPTGNVSLSVSDATPATGAAVSVSATVMDQTGTVVPGLSCTFQILSQPGTDAVVDPGPYMTDANGLTTSTLSVGPTPGTITVGVSCGELSGQVSVVAGAAAALPPTGVGPAPYGEPYGMGLIAALAAGGLFTLATGSALFLTARRAQRSS